uniref:RNA-directed DNA polymerase, eukaryota n=1 Tax=Tanacetum cinerariifolium TaxID=118510 RepID=A0A699HR59_TANCI|nr:RNA-directed DNA polymerase, eukaryota [Tanacetum cinerariifolium]
MANRIAGVLGDLVHEVQSAFIADRQILDGSLILNEVLQWCKDKKKHALVFKVDFEKAPTDEFQFFKGLKQGDPLFPFLFILIMESLHLSFDRVVKAGMFKGIQLSSSVNISHMFCANDAVFVGKWKGINFLEYMSIKVGNGNSTSFWVVNWIGGTSLKLQFPRLYALENNKLVIVGTKLTQQSLDCSFRREPRGGIELEQFINLKALVQNVILAPMEDRWKWDLESSGDFSVASIRKRIDDITLPEVNSKSRWIKYVPIKVNVHAWKVKTDALPSRFNISRRGIVINSIMCEICHNGVETVTHLFFSCCLVREVTRLICRWWDMPFEEFVSYEDWLEWILRLRLPAKNKMMFEGVFFVLWWHVRAFRNKLLFDVKDPVKAGFFDEVVSMSFYWCRYKCKATFSWID